MRLVQVTPALQQQQLLQGFLLLLLLTLTLTLTHAQRNAEDEAVCAKFLTSPQTSPLSGTAAQLRDLDLDERAEFSCELVLQDRFLPTQIRLTIHEGLFHLAVAHASLSPSASLSEETHSLSMSPREQYLSQRASDALRHAERLTQIMPKSFRFHYNAGQWLLTESQISNPDKAALHFYECIYGEARNDEDKQFRTENMMYLARRSYIKALGYVNGKEELALHEAVEALKIYPFDHELTFFVEEMLQRSTIESDKQAIHVVNYLRGLISDIISPENLRIGNSTFMIYEGIMPNVETSILPWSPPRLSALPSVEEFKGFIERREPFVISFGDLTQMDKGLQWKVQQWIEDSTYLENAVGEEMVTAQGILKSRLEACTASQVDTTACGQYGIGLHVRRKIFKFADLLKNHFSDENANYYVTTQDQANGDGPFRTPLHKISKDINPFNNSFFDVFMPNVTHVHLWKGETLSSEQITTSRLHRDATDNLYFLLQGRKQFTLWSPNHVGYMKTVGPSFGVNRDGLEYQFNINAFRFFVRKQLQTQNTTLEKLFDHKTGDEASNVNYRLLSDLITKEVHYLTDDLHFSMLSTNPGSTLWDSQQCYASVDGNAPDCGSNSLPIPSAVVDMLPGDVLFVPTGWFHQVKSFSGAHTAVNYWWKPPHWREAVKTEIEIRDAFHSKLWSELTQQ